MLSQPEREDHPTHSALRCYSSATYRLIAKMNAAVHFCRVHFGYQFGFQQFPFHDGAIRGPSGR